MAIWPPKLLHWWNYVAKVSFNWSADILDHAGPLRRVYTEVLEKLEAQGVARNMFQCNAITLKELQSIQSKHSESIKAAKELLNIIMKQSCNVFSCFLDALKVTDQQHVYEVIITGSCKGTSNDIITRSIRHICLYFHLMYQL